MIATKGPHQWAYKLTHILNQVLGPNHFPIDVKLVAKDISSQLFPSDPISTIMSGSLTGFEGALVPAPKGKTGWGIIYNHDVKSPGRINFTLGHELGHYLLHRMDGPPEFYCSTEDTVRWDSEYGLIEREANMFAANLLMPLDDFRSRIPPDIKPAISDISACADRYEVSFTAGCLRWLAYTSVPAVLVVSRDGFICWARSSKSAFKQGAFIKTSNKVVPLPMGSVASGPLTASSKQGMDLRTNVWFSRETYEMAFSADAYDMVFSLIFLTGDRLWSTSES